MSVLQPSDIADILPSLSDAERQTIINQAEAEMSVLLGMVPAGEVDGSFIEIVEGDEAGPLNIRQVSYAFYPDIDARLLELPNGPITRLRSVTLGTDDPLDLTELPFVMRPWSLKWRDRDTYFRQDVLLTLAYDLGWDATSESPSEPTPLPLTLHNAIRTLCVRHSLRQDVSGALAAGEVKQERLGPLTTSYVTSADASAMGGQPDLIYTLIGNWAKPTGLP